MAGDVVAKTPAKTDVLNKASRALLGGHIIQNSKPISVATISSVAPFGLGRVRFDFGNDHGVFGIRYAVALNIPGDLISPFFNVSYRHPEMLILSDLVLCFFDHADVVGYRCAAALNFFATQDVKNYISEVVYAYPGTVDRAMEGRSGRTKICLGRTGKRESGSLAVPLKPCEQRVFRRIDCHGVRSQAMPHAISTIGDHRSRRKATSPVSSAVSAKAPPPPPLLFPHLNFNPSTRRTILVSHKEKTHEHDHQQL